MARTIERAELTLAILAGGAATRLGGVDKGLAVLLGKPLVAHAVDRLRAQTGAMTIIANRNLDDYAQFARVHSDAGPGFAGPLAGIAAAFVHCGTSWLVTVPVDCPSPPSDLVARLAAAAYASEGEAFVVHDGERRQPLFALYRSTLARSAQAALGAGQGVWQWQTAIGADEVDFSDRRRQFVNLNTAEDFAAYAAEPVHAS